MVSCVVFVACFGEAAPEVGGGLVVLRLSLHPPPLNHDVATLVVFLVFFRFVPRVTFRVAVFAPPSHTCIVPIHSFFGSGAFR